MTSEGTKGFVHIYTGDGKGKTSAAFGMALRAAGAGFKVYIAQFMKKGNFSESKAVSRFENLIELKQFGSGSFIKGKPSREEQVLAKQGLEEAKKAMLSGRYRLVILDEVNCAIDKGLFSVNDILDFISSKPEETELILTGRNADQRLIAVSDLATEMKELKHYFKKGVGARKGFEF